MYGQCDRHMVSSEPYSIQNTALPPFAWYQIILLCDRGTYVCEQLAQGRYMKVERSGLEPKALDDNNY